MRAPAPGGTACFRSIGTNGGPLSPSAPPIGAAERPPPTLGGMVPPPQAPRLTDRTVLATWWPLAASWLLMGAELPLVSAVVARLPEATVHLAAFGGIVFPLSMLFEAPIIMLLSASTALSRDRDAYRLLFRCTAWMGGTLTAVHALVAFTPLYDVVAGRVLHVPAPILEPGRIGLRLMTPWTVSIAYRRFQQGVLIRSGRAWAVGVGTAVRLGTEALLLGIGLATRWGEGVRIGASAVAAGVVAEAAFSGIAVRPALRRVPATRAAGEPPLTLARFVDFYAPLALTSVLSFLAIPVASAAMSRMPAAIASLAAWPVVNGLVFALRSTGYALNEVVVALLERPDPVPALRRFSRGLALALSALLLAIAATPLGHLWLVDVSALPPALAGLASVAVWLAVALPAGSALQSWYQGALLHGHRTRAVTESVGVYAVVVAGLLGAGIALGRWPGLPVNMVALTAGTLAQVLWMRRRARAVIEGIEARAPAPAGIAPAGEPAG